MRKARLAPHAYLTMTDLYNVLEKLRGSAELTDRERSTLQDGTVTVLREYHDELDALVQAAYGWEGVLGDQEILSRLTDLNALRAQEERAGLVRYLRPAYQDPKGGGMGALGMDVQAPAAAALAKPAYPDRLAEQSAAVRQVLVLAERALSAEQVAAAFSGVRAGTVDELLELLVMMGQVRQVGTETVAYAA